MMNKYVLDHIATVFAPAAGIDPEDYKAAVQRSEAFFSYAQDLGRRKAFVEYTQEEHQKRNELSKGAFDVNLLNARILKANPVAVQNYLGTVELELLGENTSSFSAYTRGAPFWQRATKSFQRQLAPGRKITFKKRWWPIYASNIVGELFRHPGMGTRIGKVKGVRYDSNGSPEFLVSHYAETNYGRPLYKNMKRERWITDKYLRETYICVEEHEVNE